MWQAITYVTSGLTLAAFVAALVALVILRQSRRLEDQLKSADTDEKERLLKKTIVMFDVDIDKLSKAQRYDIVIRQLEMRQKQSASYVWMAAFATLLFAGFSFYSVYQLSSGSAIASPDSGTANDQTSTERCYSGRKESPNPTGVIGQQANLLSKADHVFNINWSGGLATDKPNNSKSAIVDSFARDGLLFIRYDWQGGLITLKPIIEAGTVPFTFYEGVWQQNNGTGCIEMFLVLPEVWQDTHQNPLGTGVLGGGIWFDKLSRDGGWSLTINSES